MRSVGGERCSERKMNFDGRSAEALVADNGVCRLDGWEQKAHSSLFIAMNNAIHHDE